MKREVFPAGQVVFRDKPYTSEFFTLTMDEIDRAGESFTGVLRADEPDVSYFLFFLRGTAYAAGCVRDSMPMPLSIRDFLRHISAGVRQRKLSLSKIDPVLLKGMLVFLQKKPSIKAKADTVNLDDILSQIKNENAAAFVILRKDNMHNFFYFHSGEPKMAHFADAYNMRDDMSLQEQMHLCAYPADKSPVEVMVYRDIRTSEAEDMADARPFLMTGALLQEQRKPVESAAAEGIKNKEEKSLRVRIEIIDGPQKGSKFNIPLPCTVGRRNADIRIRDMTVSHKHALLEAEGGQIIFRDLDSTNGSFIDGRRIKDAELSDGDIIQVGDTRLRINFVSS